MEVMMSKDELRKRVEATRDSYEQYEVPVAKKYTTGVVKKVFPKACYDKSWDYIMEHNSSDIRLVHGTALCFFPVPHAWIEFGDVIFDGVYQRFYDKQAYTEARGLVVGTVYTQREVWKKTVQFETKGAWY